MITKRMERTVRGVGRQAYTAAVTDLWERVAIALARLEHIAETSAAELTLGRMPGDLPDQ